MVFRTFADVCRHRELLVNLVLKDFKVRYRNMALGFLWSVLNPLVMMLVLTFVFTTVFHQGQERYPLFVLLALVPYNFFTLSLSAATNSIIDNASLVKKVVFPRQILPLSVVLSNLPHFLIQGVLLVILMLVYRVPAHWGFLALVPVFLVQLAFVVGISLWCSGLNVYYRDMRYFVESVLTVLFWVTPIFYPLSMVASSLSPSAAVLYQLNPMAGVITSYRSIVLDGALPPADVFGIAAAASLLFLAAGVVTFRRYEKVFADLI